VLSAVVLVAFSPLHPLHYLKPSYHALADARDALACVPPGASFATHDEWYTAVAARRPAAMVLGDRVASLGASYLVVAEDFPNRDVQDNVLRQVRELAAAGTYRPVCRFGQVVTYARARPGQPS
jgi:hypothetical protein